MPPDLSIGALEPLPLWNLRFLSFVGSTRLPQSESEGGTSIQSSRLGAAVARVSEACCSSAARC